MSGAPAATYDVLLTTRPSDRARVEGGRLYHDPARVGVDLIPPDGDDR